MKPLFAIMRQDFAKKVFLNMAFALALVRLKNEEMTSNHLLICFMAGYWCLLDYHLVLCNYVEALRQVEIVVAGGYD